MTPEPDESDREDLTGSFDVAIVGGGILGVALCESLARLGARVCLLEAATLASAASGRGFAWINATSKASDPIYHRLNHEGVRRYDTLAERLGEERIGLHRGGALYWAAPDDPGGAARLEALAAQLSELGYPAALLTGTQARPLEPAASLDSRSVALHVLPDCWIDAPRLVRALAEEARARGAPLVEDAPVHRVEHGSGGFILHTGNTRVAACRIVACCGVSTPELLSSWFGRDASAAFPLTHSPGTLLEVGSLPDRNRIQRVLFPPDPSGLHLRPTPSGGLLIGADDTDALVLQRGDIALPEASAILRDRASKALAIPLPEGDPRICMRPLPEGGRPIVGPVPGAEGALAMLTHSGITLGPLLADMLAAEMLSGTPSVLLESYRPHPTRAAAV